MQPHSRSPLLTLLLTAALSASAGLCAPAAAIVADHTAVDRCADIPQPFIDLVKRMWVTVPGESHSSGYRIGLALLEAQDSRFQVNIRESGTPEAYTDAYLRFSRASWGTSTTPPAGSTATARRTGTPAPRPPSAPGTA